MQGITIKTQTQKDRNLQAALGLLVVIAIPAWSPEARADVISARGFGGVGPVVGIGFGPEQVHFGLRFGLGELSNRLDLRGAIEGGIGDNHTRGAFLVDALYRFRERWDAWQPYAGGGLSVGVIGHDGPFDNDPPRDNDTDVEPGLNIIGGVAKGIRTDDIFQTELRIGIGEAPDLGFSVGWLFR